MKQLTLLFFILFVLGPAFIDLFGCLWILLKMWLYLDFDLGFYVFLELLVGQRLLLSHVFNIIEILLEYVFFLWEVGDGISDHLLRVLYLLNRMFFHNSCR